MKHSFQKYFLKMALALLTLHFYGFAQDEELSGIPGAFAPVSMAARGEGMAGAQTARPVANEAFMYNPAALALIPRVSLGYSFNPVFQMVDYHYTSIAGKPTKGPWRMGASFMRNGDEIYAENEVNLGLARVYFGFLVGANLKLRSAGTGSGGTDFLDPETGKNTKVEGSGIGWTGFDLGVIRPFFEDRLHLGVALRDLASGVSWSTENEAGTAAGDYFEFIPWSLRLGGSVIAATWIELSMDLEPAVYEDSKNRLSTATEIHPLGYLSNPVLQKMVALRAGFRQTIMESNPSRFYTFGGSLKYEIDNYRFSLDGAYVINTIFEKRNAPVFGLSIQY
jgi:hypothetical protein